MLCLAIAAIRLALEDAPTDIHQRTVRRCKLRNSVVTPRSRAVSMLLLRSDLGATRLAPTGVARRASALGLMA